MRAVALWPKRCNPLVTCPGREGTLGGLVEWKVEQTKARAVQFRA
jgi:hypothetical protein